jgi:hypothetical protein
MTVPPLNIFSRRGFLRGLQLCLLPRSWAFPVQHTRNP